MSQFKSERGHQFAYLAQMEERLPCKQDVAGSIPAIGTKLKAGDVRLKSSDGWSLPGNRYTASRRENSEL